MSTAQPRRMAPPRGMSPGSIQRLNGECKRMVDVRLDTPPQDQPWSRIGPNLLCTECGAPGAVNIVPKRHDRRGHAVPLFSRDWLD